MGAANIWLIDPAEQTIAIWDGLTWQPFHEVTQSGHGEGIGLPALDALAQQNDSLEHAFPSYILRARPLAHFSCRCTPASNGEFGFSLNKIHVKRIFARA
jgi:hypothetical protein